MGVDGAVVALAHDPQEEQVLHAPQPDGPQGWSEKLMFCTASLCYFTWKSEKELCESPHLVLVGGPGVLLKAGVHPLPQLLHSGGVMSQED